MEARGQGASDDGNRPDFLVEDNWLLTFHDGAAIAGLFGMNFDTPFTRSGELGFHAVTGGPLLVSLTAFVWVRARN